MGQQHFSFFSLVVLQLFLFPQYFQFSNHILIYFHLCFHFHFFRSFLRISFLIVHFHFLVICLVFTFFHFQLQFFVLLSFVNFLLLLLFICHGFHCLNRQTCFSNRPHSFRLFLLQEHLKAHPIYSLSHFNLCFSIHLVLLFFHDLDYLCHHGTHFDRLDNFCYFCSHPLSWFLAN